MTKQVENNKRTNLWVVSYLFHPVWAGPAERFLRYGPGLKKHGVNMSIMTVMRPQQLRSEEKKGITVRRLGAESDNITGLNIFLALTMLAAIFHKAKRPDCLLFLNVGPCMPPFLWLVRRFNIKTICVHTMARLDYQRAPSLKRWVVNRLKQFVYNCFDIHICSTAALAKDITDLGINSEQVEVIHNGVDLARFSPPTDEEHIRRLRKELSLPENELLTLYVGLMTERKGVLLLIEAWKQFRKTGGKGWLVMVGNEDQRTNALSSFFEKWDKCTAELTPADHILILPASPSIENYFQASDLFIFLSQLEGMPNVIPEAMACGMPITTAKFRGFSHDFGREGIELLTTESNVEAVSEKLHLMLNEKNTRKSMGIKARKWVEGRQNIDNILGQYASLISRLTHD